MDFSLWPPFPISTGQMSSIYRHYCQITRVQHFAYRQKQSQQILMVSHSKYMGREHLRILLQQQVSYLMRNQESIDKIQDEILNLSVNIMLNVRILYVELSTLSFVLDNNVYFHFLRANTILDRRECLNRGVINNSKNNIFGTIDNVQH